MENVYYGTEQATMSPIVLIFDLAIIIFELIAFWKLYEKAGEPGWAAIVPIYNIVVLLKIVKMPWWHLLIMMFVPFAAFIYGIITSYKLALAFGKGTGFAILSIFFSGITIPILAFGSAEYVG